MPAPTKKNSPAFNLRAYIAQRVWLRRGLRIAAWMAILLIGLLAAISIALHAWILPKVGDFRPKIEAFASKSLGVPIYIGSISTTKQGWQSEIELHQVRIRNAQGHSDLAIDTVQVAASPWRLLQRGLNGLVLIRPKVHIRRQKNGTIHVAGLLVHDPNKKKPDTPQQNTGVNWLLSQNSIRIQNGSITWHDATRNVAPLTFTTLNANLTNTSFLHHIQATIQAPKAWGSNISIQGRWRHGLTQPASHWQAWKGKADLTIDKFDVSAWEQYINFGKHIAIRKATGKLLISTQWHAQNKRDFTVDATLNDIDIQLGKNLPPLALKNISTQLKLSTFIQRNQASSSTSYRLMTQKLALTSTDDIAWTNGHIAATVQANPKHEIIAGKAQTSHINIALLRSIAHSLPLQANIQQALHTHQPQGTLEQLQVAWQGKLPSPKSYQLRAQGKNIGWLAKPSEKTNAKGQPVAGIPGAQGMYFNVDLTQTNGKLQLGFDKGHVDLPGVFEHPRLRFEKLNGNMRWSINNGNIQVYVPQLTFANPDAQGKMQAQWNTYPKTNGAQRFPGILSLTGNIERAKAEKVVRYLPLSLGQNALRYVAASIRSGNVRDARIKIAGDLRDIPFNKTPNNAKKTGVFNFQVPLRNTEFAFMPRYLQKGNEKPWPRLIKLNGLLEIDKSSLSLSKVTTRFHNAPDVRIHNLSAHIPNLGENLGVGVAAHLTGPLQQLFDVTRTSPLSKITNQALDNATATGNSKMQLTLGLPINRIEKSMVRGKVQLQKNDVRITPVTPLMENSTGNIQFDERGFTLQKIHTQLLGGNATLKGGTVRKGKSTIVQFKAKGVLSGQGLRDEPNVNTVAALGKFMRGSTPYTAELSYRAGAPELKLQTSLVGMELKLPYPLRKTASEPMPFRFDNTIYKTNIQKGKPKAIQDQVHIQMGNLVHAKYIRNLLANQPAKVFKGIIAVGSDALKNVPELPKSGVESLILLEKFNADAWLAVLEKGWGKNSTQQHLQPPTENTVAEDNIQTDAPPAVLAPVTQETIASRYLPNLVDMQTGLLTLNNLDFNELVVSGSRGGRLWKLSLAAKEVIGHIEYLQASNSGAGAVKARLNRLKIVPTGIEQVSSYVRKTANPKTLPLLDVEADNVEVAGYKMDSIKVLASNTAKSNIAGAELVDEKIDLNVPNAWYIHSLNIAMPNSNLQGSGIWNIQQQNLEKDAIESLLARQVLLQVRLRSSNLGNLLDHLGYKKFAENGSGLVSGTLRWDGSPVSPNLESLSGDMRIDIRDGSITQVNPGAAKF